MKFIASSLFLLASYASGQDPEILWSEEFDSTSTSSQPNPRTWQYDLGRGPNGNGWGNYELQTYTDSLDNVRIQDGVLYITAIKNQGNTETPFTSGRIKTQDKVQFKYGTITLKAKVPDIVKGLWPAFWSMGANVNEVGWPAAGEVNFMEMGQGLAYAEGVQNERVVSAAHWEMNGEYATFAGWVDSLYPLNDLQYHYYTVDWTPTQIATYVDDQAIWKMDITNTTCNDCEELHDFHFMVLNIAVGGGFPSGGTSSSAGGSCGSSSSDGGCGALLTPDDVVMTTSTMEVDWIRIYDNGFTEIIELDTAPPTTPPPTEKELPIETQTRSPTASANVETPSPTTRVPAQPDILPTTDPGEPDFLPTNRPGNVLPEFGGGTGKGKSGKSGSSKGASSGRASSLTGSGKSSSKSKKSSKSSPKLSTSSQSEFLASGAAEQSLHRLSALVVVVSSMIVVPFLS